MDETFSFGYWVRRRRKALDLTQQALAEQINCSEITIRKIESDARRPSSQIAKRLADCLRIAPSERARFLQCARGELSVDQLGSTHDVSERFLSPALTKARPQSLPTVALPLIGREQELASLGGLLRQGDVRLLTLVGPGGAGKTRLAIQAAREMIDSFIKDVFFVSLSSIKEPRLVASAIAQALGIQEIRNQPAIETLQRALCTQTILLVLDNFEHVMEASFLIPELLQAAPQLKVLVTSRVALRLACERELPITTLNLPNPARSTSPDYLLQFAAVQLFVVRAQATRPAFVLTSENAATIAAICRRLDGLPLAIELAAVRIKLLSPQALLERLNQPLHILTDGPRDIPQRQQTLRDTFDWSYALLAPEEQRLFARLAVFARDWSLDAAERICSSTGTPLPNILSLTASLLDQSLIYRVEEQVHDQATEPRFGMLETLREYAWERLAAAGMTDLFQQHHAHYYLNLAEMAEPELWGANQHLWIHRLHRERDNVRIAIQWSLRTGAFEIAARFCRALWRFWWWYGSPDELHEWLDTVLAQPEALSAELQAEVYKTAGIIYAEMDNAYEQAGTLYAQSLDLFQKLAHPSGTASVLSNIGIMRLTQGKCLEAVQLLEQSLLHYREQGDLSGQALVLSNLGAAFVLQGEYQRGTRLIEESLELRNRIGTTWGIAGSLNQLGKALIYQGNLAGAERYLRESLHLWRTIANPWGIATVLMNLGLLAMQRGALEEAQDLLHQSLLIWHDLHDRTALTWNVMRLAELAALRDDMLQAARLWGATETQRTALDIILPPVEDMRYARLIDAARVTHGPAWETAWAEGHRLSLEQVVLDLLREG